jgi:hypothetical protein
MATLKTSGLALDLTCCLAVQNGELQDFVANSTVTIASSANCIFSAAQWRSATSNGSSHEYVATNGTTGVVEFGTGINNTRPLIGLGGSRSVFIAFAGNNANLFASNGDAAYLMGAAANNGNIGHGGFSTLGGSFAATGALIRTNQSGDAIRTDTTGQFALALCMKGATTDADAPKGYFASATGAMTESTVATPTTSAADKRDYMQYLGCRDFTGKVNPLTARYFLVAQFARCLTASELETLNSDWFGTLFDAGDPPVATARASLMLMGVG